MNFPNQHCGECPRWLAFCEPDTPEEVNLEIMSYCFNSCRAPLSDEDREWLERIADKMCEIGCTSFRLTPEEIRNLLQEE